MRTNPTPAELAKYEALLQFLRDTRAFDFTAYKRATLGQAGGDPRELFRARLGPRDGSRGDPSHDGVEQVPDPALVVIGASAGGVEALRRIFSGLPSDFGGAICIVLHIPSQSPSVLPAIISRAGRLSARHACDGDPLLPGAVLIGPPDHHLLVQEGRVRLWTGPHENRHRPAVDPLFRSAAAVYGSSVIGVVLSGALDDGAAGLATIKAAGGIAVVQSPGDAAVPDMPRNALECVAVDYAVPANEIAGLLVRLVADMNRRAELGAVSDELHAAKPEAAG